MESLITGLSGTSLTNPIVNTVFPTVTGNSTRIILAQTRNSSKTAGQFSNRLFRLRFTMNVTLGTNLTVTALVYLDSRTNVNLTTFTSDTLVVSTGHAIGAAVPRIISNTVDFIWNPQSQILSGVVKSNCNTTYNQAATTNATLTNIDNLGFAVGVIFGTSNGSNSATLIELALDQT